VTEIVSHSDSDIAQPLEDARLGLRVIDVPDVSPALRSSMLSLLRTCYANVTAEQFHRDLSEKEWVVVGREPDASGVWFFTTLRRIRFEIDGHAAVAFYSGDTASRPDTRGGPTSAGTRLVLRKMFREMAAEPDSEYYWYMISSTYKSYRILSLLFRDFAPGPARQLSDRERDSLTRLAALKGFTYDGTRSVVRFSNPSVPLLDASVERALERRDPMAEYFDAANPLAREGERLASLTRLSVDNLTPLGQRFAFDPGAAHE
jgi:hypothetical protein